MENNKREDNGFQMEEKIIDGVLHFRINNDKDFFPADAELLTRWYMLEKENAEKWRKQWQGAVNIIAGKELFAGA